MAELDREGLQKAVSEGRNLAGVNLRGADLRGAYLPDANLREVDLRGANLRGANLREANLREVDLREANLLYASLNRADLRGAHLPSPPMMLSATWTALSDELRSDLMNYDASCHPDPAAFERWAAGGECPYIECPVERASNFAENRYFWDPSRPPCRPFDLMVRLLREVCADSDWHE